MLELTCGQSRLGVLPETGGALAYWTHAGDAVFHPVSDPNLAAQHGQAVAAYPLIPFSNRVDRGRFSFEGTDYQLANNFGGEPHAIHGNAWERVWTVDEQGDDYVRLILAHEPPADPSSQWPFRYRAAILYRLQDGRLEVHITVHNTDERDQPVGIGFHPFYPKTDDTRLGFAADGVWESGPDGLPRARLPASGDWAFDPPRGLDGVRIDNCFTGWPGTATIDWPGRKRRLTLEADALFGHIVVYVPPGRDFLAAEPASNMTDAINRMDIPDQGLKVLRPGESLSGGVGFSLSSPD